jgi:hypothetical protein
MNKYDGRIRLIYPVRCAARACVTGGRMPMGIPQAIQDIFNEGALKGKTGWQDVPAIEHIRRALLHCSNHISGDTSEPHLRHALCRLAMAVAVTEGMTSTDLPVDPPENKLPDGGEGV